MEIVPFFLFGIKKQQLNIKIKVIIQVVYCSLYLFLFFSLHLYHSTLCAAMQIGLII